MKYILKRKDADVLYFEVDESFEVISCVISKSKESYLP